MKQTTMSKKTTANEHTIIGTKRFDRLLSDAYATASSRIYKRIPRTHSFTEIDEEPLSDVKDSALTSTIDTRRISAAAIRFQKSVAAKSAHNDGLAHKLMHSRRLSRSTSFLPVAEETQKKILYNWSGLHEIARETQIVRPKNVNQLVQLVRTATSKVSLIFPMFIDMQSSSSL
jgi:hypothetical protein